jgi:sugar diacid utilization regulator
MPSPNNSSAARAGARTRGDLIADPALTKAVLSGGVSSADRRRARRLLGLEPRLPLRVAAVSVALSCDPVEEAQTLVEQVSRTPAVRIAPFGELALMLIQPLSGDDSTVSDMCTVLRQSHPRRFADGSLRVGVGGGVAPTAAEKSWEQAIVALRFAAPRVSGTSALAGRALVKHDRLGVFALLAKIPRAELRDQPDVRALDELANTEMGDLDIAALQAFCRTGSLRSAARALYVHHSTVADRLARAAGVLGWHLDDPTDRFRAQFALCALRLADSPPTHGVFTPQ